jgi:hypothetical protein
VIFFTKKAKEKLDRATFSGMMVTVRTEKPENQHNHTGET